VNESADESFVSVRLGINVELASNKIRVLTVLSVISKAGGANGNVTSIPFSTFAAALKVADDEVENWIISAITEELLDARVDELSSSVHVTYVFFSFYLNLSAYQC
jgi:hypothetical protein